jgi:hypothetical protein
MWGAISRAIFVGDPNWAWRRRVTFVGCTVFLGGIINSIWFDHDPVHSTMVMSNCQVGFLGTLGIYAGFATANDHLQRMEDRREGGPT